MVAIDVDHRRKHPSGQADPAPTARTASRPTLPRITVDGVVIERQAIAVDIRH